MENSASDQKIKISKGYELSDFSKQKTPFSFDQVRMARDQVIWENLEDLTVEYVLQDWLATLDNRTRKNYRSAMKMLTRVALLDPFLTMQAFSLVNHEAIIDRIKLLQGIQETTRQARAACYISFTRFLSRRFPGIFKKATPSREGTSKTFFRVHEKVVTEAMSLSQWMDFFSVLQNINSRDCLIGKVVLQGGKRIREVLLLRTEQINWVRREIAFKQSKTKGILKESVITYPESIMEDIKQYLCSREGYVFVSRNGKPVTLNQIANTFSKAGVEAKIPFKVTPHVLRASAVTYLKQQGFTDSDIMKITGHASSEMVNAYDKTSRADNATKKVSLIY